MRMYNILINITFALCAHSSPAPCRRSYRCRLSAQFLRAICQSLSRFLPAYQEHQNKYRTRHCVVRIRWFILINYSAWDFFGYASYINIINKIFILDYK